MHFSRVSKLIYFDSLDRAKFCPDTIQSEDVLAAVWARAGRVKDMAGYQGYPVKKSKPRQSAFNDPSVQTGYGQRHSTCYSYLHSFIHSFALTREGVETNLAQAYITTGRGGQVNQASLCFIRICCCMKKAHILNTDTPLHTRRLMTRAWRVQSVQSYAVTQVRSRLA